MDRDWDIRQTNEAARRFFDFLLDGSGPRCPLRPTSCG
jgi:hypothetical protein